MEAHKASWVSKRNVSTTLCLYILGRRILPVWHWSNDAVSIFAIPALHAVLTPPDGLDIWVISLVGAAYASQQDVQHVRTAADHAIEG